MVSKLINQVHSTHINLNKLKYMVQMSKNFEKLLNKNKENFFKNIGFEDLDIDVNKIDGSTGRVLMYFCYLVQVLDQQQSIIRRVGAMIVWKYG